MLVHRFIWYAGLVLIPLTAQANAQETVARQALQFTSESGNFSWQIGGRLQGDAAFYDGNNPSHNGTDIRRAFLDIRGQLYTNWHYRFQYDFARPGHQSKSRGIRDAYIKYTGASLADITVGHFKPPFGLEYLTSSLDTTFMEQGLPAMFSTDRRLGIGINSTHSNWTLAAAVVAGTAEQEMRNSVADDDGWNIMARLTTTPWRRDKGLFHIGLALRENMAADDERRLRFRSQPEVSVDGHYLIDTGKIDAIDKQRAYGLELATVIGPLSFQSEYTRMHLSRDQAESVDLDAWYAYTSYFLTGESRPYKNGIFGHVQPKSTLDHGGIGAWEVGLRYSSADLTDNNVLGGGLTDLTLGLNWYATRHLRFTANFVHMLEIKQYNPAYQSKRGNILAFRGQFDF